MALTRIELLTSLSVLTVLLVLACPAFGHGSHKTKALACMDNFRRHILAWVLFANDHEGVLPRSYHGASSTVPGDPGWASGWLDWATSNDNTNTLYLTDPRYAQLAHCLGRDASVFKCPEDDYLSAMQRARGWTQRARSYSANVMIGPGNAESGPLDPTFAHVTRMSEFRTPPPAECYVYLEEHPDSINDAAFFSPQRTLWTDLPASHHTRAANVAFADGHVEIHQWHSSNTVQKVRYRMPSFTVRPNNPDIAWLRDRTPKR